VLATEEQALAVAAIARRPCLQQGSAGSRQAGFGAGFRAAIRVGPGSPSPHTRGGLERPSLPRIHLAMLTVPAPFPTQTPEENP
jgi:hypothetical protein